MASRGSLHKAWWLEHRTWFSLSPLLRCRCWDWSTRRFYCYLITGRRRVHRPLGSVGFPLLHSPKLFQTPNYHPQKRGGTPLDPGLRQPPLWWLSCGWPDEAISIILQHRWGRGKVTVGHPALVYGLVGYGRMVAHWSEQHTSPRSHTASQC